MNRDVLAGTQPEVAGRLQLLWKYPPQLFVDEHENSGTGYFFPPDADPIYHETPAGLYREVEHLYGPANEAAFQAHRLALRDLGLGLRLLRPGVRRHGPDHPDGCGGDDLRAGRRDAVPGAGAAPVHLRAHDPVHRGDPSREGAAHLAPHLRRGEGPGRAVRAAAEQDLQPRQRPAAPRARPQGLRLLPARQLRSRPGAWSAGCRPPTSSSTGSPQPHRGPDYRPYGEEPRQQTLPAGTYWISLAQPQKHWVQAALNEDTYVPFPYFYDVSGWSLPLIAGIQGGSTGLPVTAPVVHAPRIGQPHRTPCPRGPVPRIAVHRPVARAVERLPVHRLAQVAAGQDWRFPYTVLLPKDVTASDAAEVRRRRRGQRRRRPGVRGPRGGGARCPGELGLGGGRYVGWQEGALLASKLGISQVGMDAPQAESPGAMMRIRTPQGPNEIEWDSDYNLVLAPGDCPGGRRLPPAHVRLRLRHRIRHPRRHRPGDRRDVGGGSVTVFGYEPNFRAVADGSATPAPGGDPRHADRLGAARPRRRRPPARRPWRAAVGRRARPRHARERLGHDG